MILAICAAFVLPSEGGQAAEIERNYLVVFQQDKGLPSEAEQIVANAGGKVRKVYSAIGALQAVSADANFAQNVSNSSSVSAAGLENRLLSEKMIFQSAVTTKMSVQGHDLFDAFQWDIKQVTNDGQAWTLPSGTGKSANGEDIVIAVVDTGIDYTHPDLKQNYVYGKSFVPGYPDPGDDIGHGTHVAGAIAANGLVMGVGPDLKLASYRVFGPDSQTSTGQVAEAVISAADDNVDVINLSLGGFAWYQDPSMPTRDTVADAKLLDRAIRYATQKGVTVVNSVGNEGVNVTSPGQTTQQLLGEAAHGATKRVPGTSGIIAVSATNEPKQLAFYSNYGPGSVDIAAPGGDLGPDFLANYDFSKIDITKACLSTFPGGGYEWGIGTSQAAPKVSAVAGLIMAKHGKGVLTPAQVKQILSDTAIDLGKKKQFGSGLVNAVNALTR